MRRACGDQLLLSAILVTRQPRPALPRCLADHFSGLHETGLALRSARRVLLDRPSCHGRPWPARSLPRASGPQATPLLAQSRELCRARDVSIAAAGRSRERFTVDETPARPRARRLPPPRRSHHDGSGAPRGSSSQPRSRQARHRHVEPRDPAAPCRELTASSPFAPRLRSRTRRSSSERRSS